MQPGLLFLTEAKLDVEIAASQAGTGTQSVCVRGCVHVHVHTVLQESICDGCTYGPKLLPSEMRDFIFIQGQNEMLHARAADGNAARKQKQMRMDEVAEVSGEDLKCSKHLASLRLGTGEAG